MDGTLLAESSIIRVSLKPPRSGWVKQAAVWMYCCQRNYSGTDRLLQIELADI